MATNTLLPSRPCLPARQARLAVEELGDTLGLGGERAEASASTSCSSLVAAASAVLAHAARFAATRSI